jgi:hypothetical protein
MELIAKISWGFEVQRYKINIKTPEVIPPGTIWRPDGQIWTPNSRLITGPNIVIDLAQQELIKIWRAIQGSVRQIEQIAVGDGLTVPLDTDVALENELDSKDITIWDDTDIVPNSLGLSTVKAQVVWLSLEAIGRISEIGLKFDDLSLVTHALFKRLEISNITQANPAVVTTVIDHGLVTGDEVHIDNVVGMTEVNDRDFTITVVDADEFSLVGEDSTGHTAYSSAGDVWLVVTKTSGEVLQTNYVITMAA